MNRGKLLVLLTALLFSFQDKEPTAPLPENPPQVLDDRLELTLVAENPVIVTPIGIAVDSLDRVFVLESNTHQPPADYAGPKSDQIKIFEDKDGDGQPEKASVFADGFKEGVNIAFSPTGNLYVVTSRDVTVLYDRDGDGRSEDRKKVLELTEPDKVYAHSALLGITFSPDGWLYVSRGNTGGALWKLVGTDGSSVTGYGDGGNIVRARPDGSQLEEVATGFWNPVDVKFSDTGHLLTVDNDPDSRGPNRLVDVVSGGDYGYQSLFGGSGINPYLAWNGELPGTLPYAVGLGEAPSGLLNANLAALPADYRGQMLASIWEESRIVRIDLKPDGVSLTGSTQVLVQGGENFRPVAFATDNKGNIYFTDWVLRNYPNHGRGRIWKLSARKNVAVENPQKLSKLAPPDSASLPLRVVYNTGPHTNFAYLAKRLTSSDPFMRHAAMVMLARPSHHEQLVQTVKSTEPLIRIGALLALQRSGFRPDKGLMRQMLTDDDARVRQRAMMWVGKAGLVESRADLDKSLTVGTPSLLLFETYLETIRHLQPEFLNIYQNRAEPYTKKIERPLPENFIEKFIEDKIHPVAVRAMAVKLLDEPAQKADLLLALLAKEKDAGMQLEVVRSLAQIPDAAIAEKLFQTAKSSATSPEVRAEALLALSRQPGNFSEKIKPLLKDKSPEVRAEAERYLRLYVGRPLPDLVSRPTTYEAWGKALQKGGEAKRGRRVFYSVQAVCAACHAIEGRGGDLGPDLTNVGMSKSLNQLIRAILQPSAEISPEWQGWYVNLKNGEAYMGRQIDVSEKEIDLLTQDKGFVTFQKKDMKDYGMSRTSLMPDGLQNQLSVEDMRDLLAFLQSREK
ncbi:PVC-type heme-binding CxxCH protein [Persicitalea sp.]|uniref:PVC-type heme-binding CxxCH protein n=1 Tax=Persicitalea sp. TaxID=3100273 RepID=UPI0035931400